MTSPSALGNSSPVSHENRFKMWERHIGVKKQPKQQQPIAHQTGGGHTRAGAHSGVHSGHTTAGHNSGNSSMNNSHTSSHASSHSSSDQGRMHGSVQKPKQHPTSFQVWREPKEDNMQSAHNLLAQQHNNSNRTFLNKNPSNISIGLGPGLGNLSTSSSHQQQKQYSTSISNCLQMYGASELSQPALSPMARQQQERQDRDRHPERTSNHITTPYRLPQPVAANNSGGTGANGYTAAGVATRGVGNQNNNQHNNQHSLRNARNHTVNGSSLGSGIGSALNTPLNTNRTTLNVNLSSNLSNNLISLSNHKTHDRSHDKIVNDRNVVSGGGGLNRSTLSTGGGNGEDDNNINGHHGNGDHPQSTSPVPIMIVRADAEHEAMQLHSALDEEALLAVETPIRTGPQVFGATLSQEIERDHLGGIGRDNLGGALITPEIEQTKFLYAAHSALESRDPLGGRELGDRNHEEVSSSNLQLNRQLPQLPQVEQTIFLGDHSRDNNNQGQYVGRSSCNQHSRAVAGGYAGVYPQQQSGILTPQQQPGNQQHGNQGTTNNIERTVFVHTGVETERKNPVSVHFRNGEQLHFGGGEVQQQHDEMSYSAADEIVGGLAKPQLIMPMSQAPISLAGNGGGNQQQLGGNLQNPTTSLAGGFATPGVTPGNAVNPIVPPSLGGNFLDKITPRQGAPGSLDSWVNSLGPLIEQVDDATKAAVPTLKLNRPISESVKGSLISDSDWAREVAECFPQATLDTIFSRNGVKPSEIQKWTGGGLNHVCIMIGSSGNINRHEKEAEEYARRTYEQGGSSSSNTIRNKIMVKVCQPIHGSCGEASETEHLRRNLAGIAKDSNICFPVATYRGIVQNNSRTRKGPGGMAGATGGGRRGVGNNGEKDTCYDIIVLEFVPNCITVKALCEAFEKANQELQERTYRHMEMLMGRTIPELFHRYYLKYNRKMGDGKADNILITTDTGKLIMCDIGSTFNASIKPCDKAEFLRSIPAHYAESTIKVLKASFEGYFANPPSSDNLRSQVMRNDSFPSEHERQSNIQLLKLLEEPLNQKNGLLRAKIGLGGLGGGNGGGGLGPTPNLAADLMPGMAALPSNNMATNVTLNVPGGGVPTNLNLAATPVPGQVPPPAIGTGIQIGALNGQGATQANGKFVFGKTGPAIQIFDWNG